MKIYMHPIDVICASNKEGILTPIRFRTKGKDGENKIINVNRVKGRGKENLAANPMLIYNLECSYKDVNIPVDLKYEIRTCKWYLYRI